MTTKLRLVPDRVADRLPRLSVRVADLDGLAALWLFGSFARGEATPVSDVDLAYLQATPSEELDQRLYRAVTEALGTDEVTLVDVRTLPVTVAWNVAAEGQPVVVRDVQVVALWLEELLRLAPDAFRLRADANADFLRGVLMEHDAVDRERVVELLRMVAADLGDLRAKARVSRESFLASRDLQAVVERRLQTAVEGCLNVGNHIIARRRLGVPRDYAEVFRILGQAGVLSPQVAEDMADMARPRNLLVHLYWKIDHAALHESLPCRVATLESFVQDVGRWLSQSSST